MKDPGFTAVQTIPGIGPVLAAVFVAEIGDVTRFTSADKLTCRSGMTPTHHESDTKVRRGRITKQGSRLVRWAAVESVQRLPKSSHLGAFRDQVGARRGHNIGVVAAARRQLEYIDYALRDHHVRGSATAMFGSTVKVSTRASACGTELFEDHGVSRWWDPGRSRLGWPVTAAVMFIQPILYAGMMLAYLSISVMYAMEQPQPANTQTVLGTVVIVGLVVAVGVAVILGIIAALAKNLVLVSYELAALFIIGHWIAGQPSFLR